MLSSSASGHVVVSTGTISESELPQKWQWVTSYEFDGAYTSNLAKQAGLEQARLKANIQDRPAER
jgi:hypothetical protein